MKTQSRYEINHFYPVVPEFYPVKVFLRRIHLWLGIVGRYGPGEYRLGPVISWYICCVVHDDTEDYRKALVRYRWPEVTS